uniref:Uncharacterized protein n=1 Tax=Aegilops tauschii TaxID=37682 RepID=M8BV39_AEGTA
MEDFYREIYAVDGVHHIDFPQHYPVSRLLGPYPPPPPLNFLAAAAAAAAPKLADAIADYCSGCVEVVGCVRSEELVCWEDVPQSVRLEGLTDFCWLCENPQKLVVPFEMRGYQGVYNLERRVYEGAARGLSPVQGPLPVKFPLPDPRNPLSLKPGSLNFDSSKSALVKTESVSAAIAGARAAATQYSRKGSSAATSKQFIPSANPGSVTCCPEHSIPSAKQGSIPCCPEQFIPFGKPESIACCPEQSILLANSGSSVYCSEQSILRANSEFSVYGSEQSILFANSESSVYGPEQSILFANSESSVYGPEQSILFAEPDPSFLQHQNAEPRRSPRLQGGAPHRFAYEVFDM